MEKVKKYIKAILTPVIIGGIIGIIISPFIDYSNLKKPLFSPPSIIFPIVWTILYILMGISYGRLKSKKLIDSETKLIYYVQLGVNSLWSIFFFLIKWRLFSIIWIIILAILIILMIFKFYKKDKIAGLIQIPYLLWVILATYLNIAIYVLNK